MATHQARAYEQARWEYNQLPLHVRNAPLFECQTNHTCTTTKVTVTALTILMMIFGFGFGSDPSVKRILGEGTALGFTITGVVGTVVTAYMIFKHCIYDR